MGLLTDVGGSCCTLASCQSQNVQCGPIGNGCNQTLDCGKCQYGQQCQGGHCGGCKQALAPCTGGAECCSGTCKNGTCCKLGMAQCGGDADCCSGQCRYGACCALRGEACNVSSNCCAGMICDFSSGQCLVPRLGACSQDSDCQQNGRVICSGGVCRGDKDAGCYQTLECIPGYVCAVGSAGTYSCVEGWFGTCSNGCGLQCVGGTCCQGQGAKCGGNPGCCSGYCDSGSKCN
jgi:hypothetical protein